MNPEQRKLTVTTEDGVPLDIYVLDIIDSEIFNKEFIIYTIGNNTDHIYASIMTTIDDNVTLEKIDSKEEIDYINKIIDETAEEED